MQGIAMLHVQFYLYAILHFLVAPNDHIRRRNCSAASSQLNLSDQLPAALKAAQSRGGTLMRGAAPLMACHALWLLCLPSPTHSAPATVRWHYVEDS